MNEVEKMYENAGIKPYIYCSKPQLDCDARETGNCKQDCEYYSGERSLTPFTAEKQLELIKWLLKNYDIGLSQLGQRIDTSLDGVNCISGLGSGNTFEESLAQAINDLWQDITEEEQQQVKGILE